MKASYLTALADPNPNSMREHLALLDGVILPAALKRGIESPGEGETDPLDTQMRAIETKSKLVKRLHMMEDNQKIKFTEAGLELLIIELVTIIAEYIDASTLQEISTRLGVRALSTQAD